MGAFKKYVRPEGGGDRGVDQKRTWGGGGGLSPLRTFAFQKNCMANFVHAGYSYRII